MPKKPERTPTPAPKPTRRGNRYAALLRVRRTSAWSGRFGVRSIEPPTTIISRPNSARSFCPSTDFATVELMAAPATPASVNTEAQDHLTLAARAWAKRLVSALTETASALAPPAICGEATPPP